MISATRTMRAVLLCYGRSTGCDAVAVLGTHNPTAKSADRPNIGIVFAGARGEVAQSNEKLVPQPQADLAFGLRTAK
jgi:hypothetical protein